MKTISTTKHIFKNSIAAIAAGALLVAPTGAVFAHHSNGKDGRNDRNNNRSNNRQVRPQARQAAASNSQRGPVYVRSNQHGSWNQDDDNQRGGGWWGDWRFNNGRENHPDQNSCEARQANANKQTDRLKQASQFMLSRLAWQVNSQEQYASKHNLSPENFDALKTTANTDKTTAQNAINVLNDPQIDCSQDRSNDASVLQANKKPVLEALRVYNIDAVNISYAVQAAR